MPAKTPSERRAEVDGKLDESLGKFDERLRREQQRSAEERDTRAASGGAGGGADASGGGGSSGSDAGRDRAGDLKSEGGAKGNAGTAGASGSGDPGVAGNGNAKPGASGGGGSSTKPIPSGEDDDIIARRLRKAAEAETDPELKEKLWQEYRDYKENTGGRK